ncbi:cation:proton antiporter [Brachybacterium subflavum]|uniref:cation:proton antiporter n=1 Tax=Brachybacterium subflavum TaxID=2585206 RepID=UPI00187AF6E4|nr:sodium:proton antiporter [Brachybacterium subflavum]
MTLPIALAVAAIIVICATDVIAPRVRTAAPLILVGIGILVSVIPGVPAVEIEPELILEVILPPLLYASAVRMPAISFRRDIYPISALSIILVITSSLALGGLFAWLIPGVSYVWGVALGAVLSPTDAVATSIIRGGRVPGRVVTILEGESLLNDATALVILRTAIVATASGFSLAGALGSFAWSLVVAIIIGALVAAVSFAVRKHIESATVNTALTFTLPFIASVPTEMLGSSGLVAAVVAGLITGTLDPRVLPPRHRMSSAENWASIQLLLEGFVFLTMGLQITTVLESLHADSFGILAGLGLTALALVVTLAVRSLLVRTLLKRLRRSRVRGEAMNERIEAMQRMIDAGEEIRMPRRGGPRRGESVTVKNTELFATRLRRARADSGYYSRQDLGRSEGMMLVWGGMRGAVTVAAAQTLPASVPHRPLLVFVAFAVATLSLLIQGGTVGRLANRLFPAGEADAEAEEFDRRQREAIFDLLAGAAAAAGGSSTIGTADGERGIDGEGVDESGPDERGPDQRGADENGSSRPGDGEVPAGHDGGDERNGRSGAAPDRDGSPGHRPDKAEMLRILRAQRKALLDARDDGLFDAEMIEHVLATIDAEQISVEMRGAPVD